MHSRFAFKISVISYPKWLARKIHELSTADLCFSL